MGEVRGPVGPDLGFPLHAEMRRGLAKLSDNHSPENAAKLHEVRLAAELMLKELESLG